jgi:DNA-binding response OmpR family regulator
MPYQDVSPTEETTTPATRTAAASAPVADEEQAMTPSYENATILLAEDDLILAELYIQRLKHEGFTVVHANNGEDVLKFVDEYHPNLIILDVMMPKMNGMDVLKNLKERAETKNIPVLIVTALVQEIEKINKMMNQADAYIVKSEVLPGEIIAMVKKKLGAVDVPAGN